LIAEKFSVTKPPTKVLKVPVISPGKTLSGTPGTGTLPRFARSVSRLWLARKLNQPVSEFGVPSDAFVFGIVSTVPI
jgi:hypothetical protein